MSPGGPGMGSGGMMGAPGPGGMMNGPPPGMMMHPVPGRRHSGFFAGSPRRGGSRSNSRSPYVQSWTDGRRRGTPSTPSVGSVDDGLVGLRNAHESMQAAGVKREREYDEPEGGSSSDESDDDEDSDEDSVIFEDGSVSDSLNLSLRGESKEPDTPIEIQIGEDLQVSEIMS